MHIAVVGGSHKGLSGIVTNIGKLYVSFRPYQSSRSDRAKRSSWDYCRIIEPPVGQPKTLQQLIVEKKAKKTGRVPTVTVSTSTSRQTSRTTTKQRCETFIDVLTEEMTKLSMTEQHDYLGILKEHVISGLPKKIGYGRAE